MIVNLKDIQDDFGKYLEIASEQEIVITRDGLPVARLIGMNDTLSFLAERLVGIIPRNVNEDEMETERLARQ